MESQSGLLCQASFTKGQTKFSNRVYFHSITSPRIFLIVADDITFSFTDLICFFKLGAIKGE
jgi:hypothetical protein